MASIINAVAITTTTTTSLFEQCPRALAAVRSTQDESKRDEREDSIAQRQQQRRHFILDAAEQGTPVPTALCEAYEAWIDALMEKRGGVYARASGDHHGFSAFFFSLTFGLPHVPSLDAFLSYGRAAAAALACLASHEDGMLIGDPGGAAEPPSNPAEKTTTTTTAEAVLIAWLNRLLSFYDDRAALYQAAFAGDLVQLEQALSVPSSSSSPSADTSGSRVIHIDEQLPGWPPEGFTCLHVAASKGHTATVAWLLERGADLHAPSCNGRRAMHFAAAAKHEVKSVETVSQLLAHQKRLQKTGRKADVDATDSKGQTALHHAAYNGRLGATKALLLAGADAKARDEDGYTPKDWANTASQEFCCKAPGADWGACIALLDKVAPMDEEERHAFVLRSWGLHVSQALQDAIEGGEVGMMELIRLLECYGDHINAQDHDGTTALHSAALAGSGRIVALLLSYNADVHVVSTLGETALHFAAREGHFEAAMLLSQSGGSDGNSDGGAQLAAVASKAGATALELAHRHKRRDWEAVASLFDGLQVS